MNTKTIREYLEAKNPPKAGAPAGYDWFWVDADYQDAFHDCDVLAFEAVGDYQGDYFVMVRDLAGRYGFTVIGYGSCSGCDALESSTTGKTRAEALASTVELLEGIRAATHWEPNAERMRAYLTAEVDHQIKETYCTEQQKSFVWTTMLAALDKNN